MVQIFAKSSGGGRFGGQYTKAGFVPALGREWRYIFFSNRVVNFRLSQLSFSLPCLARFYIIIDSHALLTNFIDTAIVIRKYGRQEN